MDRPSSRSTTCIPLTTRIPVTLQPSSNAGRAVFLDGLLRIPARHLRLRVSPAGGYDAGPETGV